MRNSTINFSNMNASRAIASTFGTLAGLSNIHFGIIEVLEGSIKPDNFMFVLNNQPALTIVPNFLTTGILGIIFGLFFVVWSLSFVQVKKGGIIMIIIALIQMLFGASLIRIPQEIIFGLIGTRINKPLSWWKKNLPEKLLGKLGKIWPWTFITCAILYLIHLTTGEIELLFKDNKDTVHLILMIVPAYFNLFLIVMTIITGFAHDIYNQKQLEFNN